MIRPKFLVASDFFERRLYSISMLKVLNPILECT